MKKKLFLALFAIFLLSILISSFYIVEESCFVIVTRFGKPVRTLAEAGLYIKLPGFIDKINKFDQRISIFETEPIQFLLSDKNPIIINCYVMWRINDSLLFFQSIGRDSNAVSKLSDMVNSSLGIVLSDYASSNIINTKVDDVKVFEIEQKVVERINLSSVAKYGVKVIKTGVKRISYPSTVTNAVYERMMSERKKEAEKIKAEGMEEASKIRTEAEKKANDIISEADKTALIIKGEADSESMKIYSSAFRRDPELFNFFQFLESYEKIFKNNTTVILTTDSPLLKYLNIDSKK